MSSLTVVAVTAKIIPANLEDLKCLPEMTATDVENRWNLSVNEYLIRSQIWEKQLQEMVLDNLGKMYVRLSEYKSD